MQNGDRPLVDKLCRFADFSPISFHVPGHKNGLLSGLPDDIKHAFRYDVTELSGLDDLHEPEGVIQEAQEKLATCYGTEASYFLVNGTTVGNLAMLYATCSDGDRVLVQRNAHKSIFHALELTNVHPVFLAPEWDEHTQSAGVVTAGQVNQALERYPDIKAVILTYPTYYGVAGCELQSIIDVCHQMNIPVLVDEAHGAHFIVGDPFPQSAVELGADLVVQSAHKTLPAMTMASFLHIRSSLIKPEQVERYLRMLQSSSPSYLLMASLDDARAYIQTFTKQDLLHFQNVRTHFIESLRTSSGLEVVETDDPLKVLLRVDGVSGYELQHLIEEEGVYSELADPFQVLLMLPLVKIDTAFPFQEAATRIKRAAARSLAKIGLVPKRVLDFDTEPLVLSNSLGQVARMEKEWISIKEAIGRLAAEAIIPYPPGIPLLLPGEKINVEHIQTIEEITNHGARFQGGIRINEDKIHVAKK